MFLRPKSHLRGPVGFQFLDLINLKLLKVTLVSDIEYQVPGTRKGEWLYKGKDLTHKAGLGPHSQEAPDEASHSSVLHIGCFHSSIWFKVTPTTSNPYNSVILCDSVISEQSISIARKPPSSGFRACWCPKAADSSNNTTELQENLVLKARRSEHMSCTDKVRWANSYESFGASKSPARWYPL